MSSLFLLRRLKIKCRHRKFLCFHNADPQSLVVVVDRIQITAEQLLREAKEKQLEYVAPPPRQKISDPEELAEYRMKKRKEFEDAIRKNRSKMVNWVKYAHWEESQQEIQRESSSSSGPTPSIDEHYSNVFLCLSSQVLEVFGNVHSTLSIVTSPFGSNMRKWKCVRHRPFSDHIS